MYSNINRLEIGCFQLTAKRQRNLATIALATCQFAMKFPKLHYQMANKPTSTPLSVITKAIKFNVRYRNLLKFTAHQI